jgi:hypothetical protein
MVNGFEYDTALRLLQESSERWGRESRPGEVPDSRMRSVERFAFVLAALMSEPPSWVETVMHPQAGGEGETEVRALGQKALCVISNPWAAADADVSPIVRVRPLSSLRGLDLDGFEFDEDGRPVGCTATLLFDPGDTVRLGASPGADRVLLRTLVPSLLARLGV